jgi:hypothetical protein
VADEVTLDEAYRIAFATPAGIMVLRDLAQTTGFMSSLPIGTKPEILIEHNAGRRLFGRLFEILALSEDGREALAVALRPAKPQE